MSPSRQGAQSEDRTSERESNDYGGTWIHRSRRGDCMPDGCPHRELRERERGRMRELDSTSDFSCSDEIT